MRRAGLLLAAGLLLWLLVLPSLQKATTLKVPRDAKIQHSVSGSAYIRLDVTGLEKLRPLPEGFTIRVVLPKGFKLELPDSFSAELGGTVRVEEAR